MKKQQKTITHIIDYILSDEWLAGYEPDSDEQRERMRSGNRAVEILHELRCPVEWVRK